MNSQMNLNQKEGNGIWKLDMMAYVRKYGVHLTLLILIIINSIITPNFFNINTLWNIIIQSSTIMLVSLGMTVVISASGIDISVGSTMALSSIILVKLLDFGILPAIIGAIIVSMLFGFINGYIISKFNIQPMVVTLAMMTAIRGIAQIINDGRVLGYTKPEFSQIAYHRIYGILPVQLIIIVIAIALVYFLVNKMSFGRYVEAIGDNAQAASYSGVNTTVIILLVYLLSSILAGFGGIIEAARLSAADANNIGRLIEADAIAATAIGGTPMTGGKPNIFGTVMGVFIMQIITVMVNMNNVPYSYALVIKTAIIIFAVYIQKKER